jgi:hypothetical protein
VAGAVDGDEDVTEHGISLRDLEGAVEMISMPNISMLI